MLKKRISKYLVLLLIGFSVPSIWAAPPKYPALKEMTGQVWMTGKDGQRQPARNGMILREKALIETSSSGRVKVQLDANRSVRLLGGSEVLIPVIGWDSGEVPVVILKTGSMHWLQSEQGGYNIALRSDLFEFLAVKGSYILTISPKSAMASVKMFDGTMEFSALNGEESVRVKAGQEATFQGIIEGGEISYDVLLKGKKIPKGRLLPVKEMDVAELGKEAVAEKKRLADLAKVEAQEKDRIAKSKREGVICSKPSARLNECVWVCLNNPKGETKKCLVNNPKTSCVRRRCNANGEWAEETKLENDKAEALCRAQPVVATCDY